MSYAFISLTPLWCEVNVFLFFLVVFFCCYLLFFSSLLYFIFVFIYSFIYLFSNTIRPRKIDNVFIGIIILDKWLIRE